MAAELLTRGQPGGQYEAPTFSFSILPLLSPLFFFKVFLIDYFWAVVGLNCSMWDLSLWGAGFSLNVAPGLSSRDLQT